MHSKSSFSVIELIFIACLIFVMIGVFAVYINRVLKISREEALRNELINLRMSIEYFRVINKGFPKDLSELSNKNLTIAVGGSKIIPQRLKIDFKQDRQGFLLDPFMNKYIYDREKGSVYSQTKGYEKW